MYINKIEGVSVTALQGGVARRMARFGGGGAKGEGVGG